MAHYIGLDVGTGSARACLIDEKGDILSVATKDIKTWHEKADYYVRSLDGYRSDCRNNRRRTSGLLAAMLRNRSSRKQLLILPRLRELDLMRHVHWLFSTNRIIQSQSLDLTSRTLLGT